MEKLLKNCFELSNVKYTRAKLYFIHGYIKNKNYFFFRYHHHHRERRAKPIIAMMQRIFSLSTSSSSSSSSPPQPLLGFISKAKKMGMVQSPSLIFSNTSIFFHIYNTSKWRNIDHSVASFNHMLHRKPSTLYCRICSPINSSCKDEKKFETAVSLSKEMELAGITHNIFSLNILVNSFCHLHRVDLRRQDFRG
jgi:hypothetical protein